MKEDLVESQETAGFHELELRQAVGSHFNHLFLWSILNHPDKVKSKEPAGKLKEFIEKFFTNFESFKTAFKKTVSTRVTPGWVWLGINKEKQLIIT
mmetsp:Transcript_10232/g.7653  ORF Transcript_10232/g.7653 Transcript_10232/m.7653 type:complete len:96 (+) Transcript_10232:141-428(+)